MKNGQELSARERAVLEGIGKDKTYAEIAHNMNVSHETVKRYAVRLRAKLGVNTKVGLALYWERHLRRK